MTNIKLIENVIKEIGASKILCIMSTTSCFAPRACDSIETIAKICKEKNIPHLINNAYGLQSKVYMERIQKAHRYENIFYFLKIFRKCICYHQNPFLFIKNVKYLWIIDEEKF